MIFVLLIFLGFAECSRVGGVVDDVLIYCKICGENITTFSNVGTRFKAFVPQVVILNMLKTSGSKY